jgi:hypothetical protein
VNFVVPDNAPAGNTVPIVLSIGGVSSNQVTLAIDIPVVEEPANGFPQTASSALTVPFPAQISGTLTTNANNYFQTTLTQQTPVQFELTGSGSFQGWLFLYNPDLSWNSYIYVTAPSTGTLAATLPAGNWIFSVSWNTASAAGPYQLLVEPAPPAQ